MNVIRIAALVLSVLFTPVVVFAQALPNANASAEFVQLQLSLNSEAERIDELEVGLERDLGRLRGCLGSLRSDQEALRAELEARIAQLEAQLAEIPQLRSELADLRAAVDRGNLRDDQLQSLINGLTDRVTALEGQVRDLQLAVNNLTDRVTALETRVDRLDHRAVRFGVGGEIGLNSDRHMAFTGGVNLALRYGIVDNTFGVVNVRLGTASDGWDLEPAVRLTWLYMVNESWSVGAGVGAWVDAGELNDSGAEAFGLSALFEARFLVTNWLEFHANIGPALALAKGGQGLGVDGTVGGTIWF